MRSQRSLIAVLMALVPAVASSQGVRDVYEHHNRAAIAARSAGDWATVRRHAAAVDTLFNGNPGTLLALARASARLGDTSAALQIVRDVVGMGVVRNLSADEDLAPLRSHPEWQSLMTANDSNAMTVGTSRVVFALPGLDFLAEDVVWDAARSRYLVSSVRKGSVVAIGKDGRSAEFISPSAAGAWGMFALAVDSARSFLWATSVAMPHVEGYAVADSARSAVLRFDLATGRLQKRYELPPTKRGNSPGDLGIGPDGAVYVSDSRSGVIYKIEPGVDSLAVLVQEGTFMSPQQSAVSGDGRALYVADYIRGLAAVDIATGVTRWLAHPRNVALNGIDGLIVAGPRRLIAIQNGLVPNRVMEVSLDEAGSVLKAAVIAQNRETIREPTHGLIIGDELHFIANSGWDGFGNDGALKKDHNLVPPVVLAVRIGYR
jgi:sugar lactone lactonase YvrE